MFRSFVVVVVACLAESSAFAQQAASDVRLKAEEIKSVPATVRDFVLNGKSGATSPPVSTPKLKHSKGTYIPGGIPNLGTWRWTKYDSLQCDVAWNETCTGSRTIDAPSGWQICKLYYNVLYDGGNSTSKSFSPGAWYTNDPMSPDRFRSYTIEISASGSQSVFYQVGARIQLGNVGVLLIPAEWDNTARYREGCEMPAHD
tara:strand:+ start:3396 stop:3998 length:603 start_codon:yes stop_codon:yes gene_type:complete